MMIIHTIIIVIMIMMALEERLLLTVLTFCDYLDKTLDNTS